LGSDERTHEGRLTARVQLRLLIPGIARDECDRALTVPRPHEPDEAFGASGIELRKFQMTDLHECGKICGFALLSEHVARLQLARLSRRQ
jgi:hypothetical protein